MKQQMKLFIVGLLMLNVSACSLPLKVEKVDSMKNKVDGVRYILKRPAYVAGLRINLKEAQFLVDPEKTIEIESTRKDIDEKVGLTIHELQKLSGKAWATASDMNNPQKNYCLKVEAEKVPLTITLQQKMDGDPIIYEATSRKMPPHWFADSESSITMDDDGYLTAITAGEDDKSLEFIQAVAGLAISAAMPLAIDGGTCLLIKDEKFHKYVAEHIQLATLKTKLTDSLNETLKNLKPSSQEMKNQLESVNLLRAEIERVDERLKIVQYDMPVGTFVVDEVKDEKDLSKNVPLVKKDAAKTPWIKFELTSQ